MRMQTAKAARDDGIRMYKVTLSATKIAFSTGESTEKVHFIEFAKKPPRKITRRQTRRNSVPTIGRSVRSRKTEPSFPTSRPVPRNAPVLLSGDPFEPAYHRQHDEHRQSAGGHENEPRSPHRGVQIKPSAHEQQCVAHGRGSQPPCIRPCMCGGATFDTKASPSGEMNSSATVRMK